MEPAGQPPDELPKSMEDRIPPMLRGSARSLIKKKIGNQDIVEWLRDFAAEGGVLKRIANYAELEAAHTWHELLDRHVGGIPQIKARIFSPDFRKFRMEDASERLEELKEIISGLKSFAISPVQKENHELYKKLEALVEMHQACDSISRLLNGPEGHEEKGFTRILEDLTLNSRPNMPPLSIEEVNDWWVPMGNFSTILRYCCCLPDYLPPNGQVDAKWVKFLPESKTLIASKNRLPATMPKDIMEYYQMLAQTISAINQASSRATGSTNSRG